MARSSGRVTLTDVAKATGFTTNTVSRALKNKPDISVQTREHIQQIAREMGYVRNYIASSLRSGRTRTIALITGSMTNPFNAVLADLIQREAFRLGYTLMILCFQDNPELENTMVEMALFRQVDGILILPWSADSPSLTLLRDSRVPYVLLNRHVDSGQDDYIIFDEEQGGWLAAKHLIGAGHRKLAMLSHSDVVFATKTRYRGFFRACLEAGIGEENVAFALARENLDVIRQLQDWKQQGFTGIFSFCDVEAWSEITLLDREGLHVPDDLAIVGFDNILGYIDFPRPICSIDCDFQEEAVYAVDLLRRRIHDPSLPPQQIVLPVSLVCHGSCKHG